MLQSLRVTRRPLVLALTTLALAMVGGIAGPQASIAASDAPSAGGTGSQQAAPPTIDGTVSPGGNQIAFGQCGNPACDH
jgi:hypothetical protein